MKDAEKYRLVAQSLRDRAKENVVEMQRYQLQALAEHFERLARDAERETGEVLKYA